MSTPMVSPLTGFRKLVTFFEKAVRYLWRRVSVRLLALSNGLLGRPRLPFYCPVCDFRLRRWRPLYRDIGHGKTRLEPNGRICPECAAFERTRHFWLYVQQEQLLASQPDVLHVAPERGLRPHFRLQLGARYVTTDLDQRGVDTHQDLTAMTLADDSFDLIYCSNVLEHIEEDRLAMGEIFRVLRPGGLAILQVPIRGEVTFEDPTIVDPTERTQHFGQADHVRYYGRDIAQRLKAAGFVVDEVYMLDLLNLGPEDIERMNLDVREPIHFCRKPQHAGSSGT